MAARHRPFTVRLRGSDTFRPVTDVVYLVVAEGAAECDALQGEIRGGPLAVELRYPYHPHVTLAHDVDPERLDRALEATADVDVSFEVAEVVLFTHAPGAPWQRLGTFPLGRGVVPAR